MSKVTHWKGGMAIGIGKGSSEAIANTGFSLGSADLYIHGQLGVNGTAYFDNTVTVGVDDTGYDVQFFGATSGAYMLWDESKDQLELGGTAKMKLSVLSALPASPDEGTLVAYSIGGTNTKLYAYLDGAWELVTSS